MIHKVSFPGGWIDSHFPALDVTAEKGTQKKRLQRLFSFQVRETILHKPTGRFVESTINNDGRRLYFCVKCVIDNAFKAWFFVSFVHHLWLMGLNVLGYQSHLMQRCHPACGHEGSSHPTRFSPYDFFSRCKFRTVTTHQPMAEFYLLKFSRFLLRTPEYKFWFS